MKLVPIIRVSTEGQMADDKAGLPRQRDAVAGVIAATGAIRLDSPEIADVSGSDLADAPEWQNVVRLLDHHPDAHVVADDLTRLIRADGFDLRVLRDLKTRGRCIYLSGGKVYDTTDARDVMVLTIFAGVGGYDKAESKRKNQSAKEAKRRRGIWVSRLDALPFGITFTRKSKEWGVNEQADDVREAFRRFVMDAAPLAALADLLHVSLAGVRVVLRNPIYRGILRYDEKRGDPYPTKGGRQPTRRKVARDESEIIEVRVFEPSEQVVTDEMWRAAQDRMRTLKQDRSKRKDMVAPGIWASGFIYSALETVGEMRPDGFIDFDLSQAPVHVIYGHGAGASKPARYVCRCSHSGEGDTGRPGVKCGLGHLRCDTVNAALDEYLLRMTTEEWFIKAVRDEIRTPKVDTATERERLNRNVKALDARAVRVRDMYEQGDIDRFEFERRRDTIKTERQTAMEAIQRLLDTPLAPTEAQLTALASEWSFDPSWDAERKRAWLRKYVSRICISNDGIESVVVAVPATGDDGFRTMLFAGGVRMTWSDLVTGSPFKPESRLAAEGRYVSSQVASRLGITVPRLSYLVASGQLPAPTGPAWGMKRTWTEGDIGACLRVLPGIRDRRKLA